VWMRFGTLGDMHTSMWKFTRGKVFFFVDPDTGDVSLRLCGLVERVNWRNRLAT
jgi:hypothetical protein